MTQVVDFHEYTKLYLDSWGLDFSLGQPLTIRPGAVEVRVLNAPRSGFLRAICCSNATAVEEPVPFLGGQVVGPAWRAAAAALPVPGWSRLDPYARDAVAMELDLVLDDGKDFQKAMADARARIRRQMERGGK